MDRDTLLKRAPWAIGGLIVLLAAIAIVLVPGRLPKTRPADLWEGAGPPAGGVFPPAPPAAPPAAAMTAVYVVEQDSPIVGEDRILTEALGIEAAGGRFRPVLPEGTPSPVGRILVFRTSVENQREVRLHILRGRSDSVAGNHSLGWVRIPDLPPGPRGATRIAVTFQVVDGSVVLAAQNPADGRAFAIEPSEGPPGFSR